MWTWFNNLFFFTPSPLSELLGFFVVTLYMFDTIIAIDRNVLSGTLNKL